MENMTGADNFQNNAIENEINFEMSEIDSSSIEISKNDEKNFLSEINHLQLISKNIPDFIYSIKFENGSEDIFYSDSVKKLTGYTSDEIKAMPTKWLNLIHPQDVLSVRKKMIDFERDSAKQGLNLEYKIIKKDNSAIYVKEKISAKRDILGNIENFTGIISDISVQKENEQNLIENENKFRELNSTKDKFIAIISHDLRAPFTSILGFSEILLNDPNLSEEEKREYLTYIFDASQNQLQFVNYLLDWAKLQTGMMKFEPQRLKASKIIHDTVSSLTGNAIRKNIEIKVEAPENLYIQGDERLLKQALTNLLSNAIKFTNEFKTIEVKANNFKKGLIEFSVKDEGIGIPEIHKNKLFRFEEKFSSEGTKGEKGTGLGLSLVKQIIEKHNGDIWFYSEENVGSEFHFTVPEAENIVLLVEDEESTRILWKKIIKNNFPDYQIAETSNGYEAMSFVLEKTPSIVITDHDMPLMNGIQLIEAMKKRDESTRVPVILIAAAVTDDLILKYKRLGVEKIIQKPVSMEIFSEALNSVLK